MISKYGSESMNPCSKSIIGLEFACINTAGFNSTDMPPTHLAVPKTSRFRTVGGLDIELSERNKDLMTALLTT